MKYVITILLLLTPVMGWSAYAAERSNRGNWGFHFNMTEQEVIYSGKLYNEERQDTICYTGHEFNSELGVLKEWDCYSAKFDIWFLDGFVTSFQRRMGVFTPTLVDDLYKKLNEKYELIFSISDIELENIYQKGLSIDEEIGLYYFKNNTDPKKPIYSFIGLWGDAKVHVMVGYYDKESFEKLILPTLEKRKNTQSEEDDL